MSLTANPTPAKEFFIAGGTLPLQSDSYIERIADAALREALLKGRFCYVLNSRQMGKSSLCVRTMARLEQEGIKCAFIDVTKIGGRNVTPEQWYAGLAIEIGRSLELRNEILEYWKSEGHISPMQRFFGALHDVVLAKYEGKVVIFIDEIDSTRSLSFSTDEFFAGVRECYNRRVQEPTYERMTFCFLGVAVPSDLIHDARTTPFNIGERIYVRDFSLEEVLPLAKQLGPNGDAILRRIFYWTNGHPFLTQSLCRALVATNATTEKEVDDLIYRDLLEPKVRETNINLSDVGNRVLNGYGDGDDIAKFRADILSAYSKALKGSENLPDDESNRITAVLKLSGLMRSEGKVLKVRNRIYERAFDKVWVKENMPGQELRRQRKAFLLGAVRTGLVAAVIVSLIAYLAINNHRLATLAEARAREQSYQAYVATMNVMPVLYEQRNLSRMSKLLAERKGESWKGLEWSFWDRMANEAAVQSPGLGQAFSMDLSQDGKQFVACDGGTIYFLDSSNAQILRTLKTNYEDTGFAQWLYGTGNLLLVYRGGGGVVIDPVDGRQLAKLPTEFFMLGFWARSSSKGEKVIGFQGNSFGELDLETMAYRQIQQRALCATRTFDDKEICVGDLEGENPVLRTFDGSTLKPKKVIRVAKQPLRVAYLHDGIHVFASCASGDLYIINLTTGAVEGHIKISEPATVISISNDDTVIAFTIRQRAAGVLDYKNGQLTFRRWYPEANRVCLLPDKERLATLYWNLRIYDLAKPGVVSTNQLGPGPWGHSLQSINGRDILLSTNNAKLLVNEVKDGQLIPQEGLSTLPANGDANDAAHLSTLFREGKKSVLKDFWQRKPIMSFDETGDHASVCQLGDKVVITFDGYRVDVYDVKTKAKEATFTWPTKIKGFRTDLQGKYVAIANEVGWMGVVAADGWKTLWNQRTHFQGILRWRFSRDGKMLITNGDDDKAALWDVATGAKLQIFEGHAQSVTDGDVVPGGSRVITVSDDHTIRVWDTKTGLEVTTLGDAGDSPTVCRVTTDGKYVLTGNRLGEIKLWPIAAR